MYEWAKPGAKVVSINSDWSVVDDGKDAEGPFEGEILTIEQVMPFVGEGIYLRFLPFGEDLYHINGFKPLVEPKALPSVLTTLLIAPGKRIKNDQFDKGRVHDPV